MDLANMDLGILLAELDGRRTSLDMSYQNVADACNVSQATIIRIFKRQSEPSIGILQKIAAAVKYEPVQEPVILEGYTPEDYTHFLQQSILREKTESSTRAAQQEAHYNMLLNQKNRTIKWMASVLFLFAAGFITWLIIDVTHPEVGWFQRELARYSGFWENIKMAVEKIFI